MISCREARCCDELRRRAVCAAILFAAATGCFNRASTTPELADPQNKSRDGEVESTSEILAAGDGRSRKDSETVSLHGRIVWTTEALAQLYDVRSVPEAKERSLALLSVDGHLYGIVEDRQGRAFRLDERLRNRDVELLCKIYPDAGMIQVIRLYFVKPEGRYLVDYWCDICSISMVEEGACDCCQEPNRLRMRRSD